jgi:hypothetical protein
VSDTNPSEEISGGVIWLLVALGVVAAVILVAALTGAAMM